MRPNGASPRSGSLLYRGVLFFFRWVFRLLYHHRVYGLEHFYEGPAILAANHSSFFDPPVLAISWPEEVHFLAREGLFKNRFFGGLIRRLNAHPVSGDAGDIAVFKAVVLLLSEGKKLILFPEGKRGWSQELGALKPGIALLVSRSNAAVIPAYIHGTFEIWNRGRAFPKLRGKTACVFGSPIHWGQFAHLDRKEGQRALTEALSERINGLRIWYEQGAKGAPP